MNQTQSSKMLSTISLGLAMFSMFFGSGNIIFPVLIGQLTQDQCLFAMIGLFITAVAIPFMGLLALSLFDGNYMKFFGRLGKYPGLFIVVMIVGLIGPFGVIPRCIAISHGALLSLFPNLSLIHFSAVSCLIILLCTANRNKIIDILGLYLTPLLLLSLFTIIIFGAFIFPAQPLTSAYSPGESLVIGLLEGYNTMDLFAAFMFSNVILEGIKVAHPNIDRHPRSLLKIYLKASFIGLGLLSLIYFGMCYVAAIHAHDLSHISSDRLLSELAVKILGKYAGLVVSVAVSLACLTTAISLTIVFSDFISSHILGHKISNFWTLIITLVIAFFISTLQFEGIQNILIPILKLSLPALIVFTFFNLLYKFFNFNPIKLVTALVFLLTLIFHFS